VANIIQYKFPLAAPVRWGKGDLNDAMKVSDPFGEKSDELEAEIFAFLTETIADYLGIDPDYMIMDDACPKDMLIHPYKIWYDGP
jgi:hypothetical protein